MKTILISYMITILSISSLSAQWQSIGPYNGQSLALEMNGNNIVSATWTGIMCSTNNSNI